VMDPSRICIARASHQVFDLQSQFHWIRWIELSGHCEGANRCCVVVHRAREVYGRLGFLNRGLLDDKIYEVNSQHLAAYLILF
jgi:hypothetical protein